MDIAQDKEILAIQKESSDLVSRAQNFQVISDVAFEDATKVISWIAGVKKKIELKRKFFTQPLNEQVKKINVMFKEYSNPLSEADRIVRNKMLSYRKVQEEKQRKEQEKLDKEAKKIAKKENIPVEEVMEGNKAQEVPKTVGATTIKKVWTFEVEDEARVPRGFLMLDEPRIREAIRKGIREINGIKIFEKETIATR